jgi:hypothetical protein
MTLEEGFIGRLRVCAGVSQYGWKVAGVEQPGRGGNLLAKVTRVVLPNKQGLMVAPYRISGDRFESGKSRPWINTGSYKPVGGWSNGEIWDLAPDGSRVVITQRSRSQAVTAQVTVRLHVFDKLPR